MSNDYRIAANVVSVGLQGKSVKRYCASLDHLEKGQYALAMQTLKFLEVIKNLLLEIKKSNPKDSRIEELDDTQQSLLYVMIYDLLFSKKKSISGGGSVRKKILALEKELRMALEKNMENKSNVHELLSLEISQASTLPLYVRINTVMLSIDEGLTYLNQKCGGDNELSLDTLIPSLISIPTTAQKGISLDRKVQSGELIIQDKASCFPSQILSNLWNSSLANSCRGHMIDACAAPGNKTSHLAACLSKSPFYQSSHHGIYAFEKNGPRFQLLSERMMRSQLSSLIQTIQQDFLSVDVDEFRTVTHIMLDPSCSGSGIVRNVERFTENKVDSEEEQSHRLQQLQSFQYSAITKASQFPAVQFIVYSTCSIHEIENELLIAKFLASEAGQAWELINPIGFESWERRGVIVDGISEIQAKAMIRCAPSDGMNGFFVAVVKRKYLCTVPSTPWLQHSSKSHHNIDKSDNSHPRKKSKILQPDSNPRPSGGNTLSKAVFSESSVTNTSAVMEKAIVRNQSFRVSNRKKRKFTKG